ncbi:hypothetical protein SLW70_06270 [Flavobacterium sp. NG2]|nr:hypothetical protein [Flavobacterium sp. NG2]WPR72731.1 hypothetical protein SLW70_06270 [Flavobacterium sp. NG2]
MTIKHILTRFKLKNEVKLIKMARKFLLTQKYAYIAKSKTGKPI